MKYKIVFLDKTPPIKGLTLDEAIQYRIDNIENDKNFKVEEQPKPVREKTEDLDTLMNEYVKTLTPAQQNDIGTGEKVIHYSKGIGYHLRRVKTSEGKQFFSPQVEINRRKASVFGIVKSVIYEYKQEIFDFIKEEENDFGIISDLEFEEAFKSILK